MFQNNKVSIIVPVRNRADLSKVCIDSIIRYTKFPYELILVQEGVDNEITNLLKGYNTKFVHNSEPQGFSGAMNAGLNLAEGTHVCFLNNDTVVIPRWLEFMMKAFEDNEVGLVSPTYTEATTKQSVDCNQGQQFDYVDDPLSLKGVCFLVKREVIDKVGRWDERFGLGGGDDSDFTTRIKNAGYKLVIARRSYIYHYGSAAFREEFKNDIDYSKKYAVGQFNKFREKHNMTNQKPKVFIAIPNISGFVSNELAVRLIEWSHDPEIDVNIKFYSHLAPLDNARNTSVKEFLESYNDYYLTIDDDIVPPSNCLRELLKANKEVIAPLCFTIKAGDDGIPFPMPVSHRYNANKEYEPYFGKGIEEVDFITGGCHLVKREVLEKLERPYYFTYHKNGTVIYSEDAVFSQQVQKLGYKLYTHYDLLCKHIRQIDCKSLNDLMCKYGK